MTNKNEHLSKLLNQIIGSSVPKRKKNLKDKYDQCIVWYCKDNVTKKEHKFCFYHWCDYDLGYIDLCSLCDRAKYIDYKYCSECENKKPYSNNNLVLEHDKSWEKADADRKVWYVYILLLNDGSYYAGQTGDLRARMWEHKNTGKTQGTKNKNPKLVWFAPLTSRESAEKTELELKKTIKKNPRIITSKILAFKDLVKELDY